MADMRYEYKTIAGKVEEHIRFWRSECRWKDV